MVWISEVCERRKPSLSASRIATSAHSGMSSPSRSRLMPTSTSNTPKPQVADDLDPLQRVDVGVQVAHLHAVLGQVVGQVLRHALGQRGHQHARALRRPPCGIRPADRPPGAPPGAPRSPDRSARSGGSPVRRTRRRCAPSPTGPAWPRRRSSAAGSVSHSSNFSGRLSTQDGRRKPNSARIDLRLKSPRIHAAELRHRHVAFVDDQQRVLRQVFEQRRRRIARIAAGQVARVVLDALAGAGRLHHFDVERRALLQPFDFQQLAFCGQFRPAAAFSSTLMSRIACVSVGRGVT